MGEQFDFAGWATKNDILCADGRTIRDGAFKENDGQTVPLVYQHQHNDPKNVLGHALLEYRPGEGMYCFAKCNDTENGQLVKKAVAHGDLTAFSIYANNLTQHGGDVVHGKIREVSVVLAGANDGAVIEYPVLAHSGEIAYDEAIIYAAPEGFELAHADNKADKEEKESVAEEKKEEKKPEDERTVKDVFDTLTEEQKKVVYFMIGQALEDSKGGSKEEEDKSEEKEPEIKHAAEDEEKSEDKSKDDGKTVKDVFDTLNEEQKKVVYFMIGQALEDAKAEAKHSIDNENEEDTTLTHNVFDQEQAQGAVLSHADVTEILNDAKRNKVGSLREMIRDRFEGNDELMHAIDTTDMEVSTGTQTYGFNDAGMLFPDYKSLNVPPEFIKRDTDWVAKVMSAVKHSPFSRIKSVYANLTEADARAKGYVKAHQKANEVFSLLKRTTDPQTIYKHQKMDRDDIVDITDFDVIAWLKSEMRLMLDEEIARAILIGDGRDDASDDKISETHVRSIANDAPLFNIKVNVATDHGASDADKAEAAIDAIIRARKNYKGSGDPTFFTTEDVLSEMLLLKDDIGHYMYDSVAQLATRLRVKEIVPVEVMENTTVDGKALMGVIVNLADYNVGSDKGGAVSLFDDFDIDYNQYKYLIETRISGALVKPYSAMTILDNEASA